MYVSMLTLLYLWVLVYQSSQMHRGSCCVVRCILDECKLRWWAVYERTHAHDAHVRARTNAFHTCVYQYPENTGLEGAFVDCNDDNGHIYWVKVQLDHRWLRWFAVATRFDWWNGGRAGRRAFTIGAALSSLPIHCYMGDSLMLQPPPLFFFHWSALITPLLMSFNDTITSQCPLGVYCTPTSYVGRWPIIISTSEVLQIKRVYSLVWYH